jgi:hypothetical protein
MDLGRFQKGEKVPLQVSTVDGSANPVEPDAAPLVVVRDPANAVVASLRLPRVGTAFDQYGMAHFLGVLFATLGTYQVSYSYDYAEGTGQGTASDTFELIAGGDEGGAVVAMFHIDRPEARYVVGQLASGKLVQGRNPRLQ